MRWYLELPADVSALPSPPVGWALVGGALVDLQPEVELRLARAAARAAALEEECDAAVATAVEEAVAAAVERSQAEVLASWARWVSDAARDLASFRSRLHGALVDEVMGWCAGWVDARAQDEALALRAQLERLLGDASLAPPLRVRVGARRVDAVRAALAELPGVLDVQDGPELPERTVWVDHERGRLVFCVDELLAALRLRLQEAGR